MKIKTISASEQIFAYMKQSIIDEKWKVNEKIPSEMELSEQFGVNRLTIRMALKRLAALGILETKNGDGTYVRKFAFKNYISQITDFYMNQDLLMSVCEFRKVVEIECARLAMENATAQEIDELKEICDEYQQIKQNMSLNSESDIDMLIDKDIEFHNKIISMSHNELFCYAYDVAKEPIRQYISIMNNNRIFAWDKKGIQTDKWNDQHEETYEAIANRDYAACKNAMLRMVDFNVDLSSLLQQK